MARRVPLSIPRVSKFIVSLFDLSFAVLSSLQGQLLAGKNKLNEVHCLFLC
jgi:hypothetical protein